MEQVQNSGVDKQRMGFRRNDRYATIMGCGEKSHLTHTSETKETINKYITMSNITLSISEVTSKAWDLSKKHGLIIAAIILIIGLIAQTLGNIGFPWVEYMKAIATEDPEAMLEALTQNMGGMIVMAIVGWLISMAAYAGLLNIVLKITKGSMNGFDLSGFKMPVKTYLNYLLVTIIMSIIVTIGTICCLIPGIFLAARLSLAPSYVLEHPEGSIGEAIERSWNMTKGNFWNIFGLGAIYVLFCLVGLLCCCIGVYFAQAIGYFILAVVYFTLSGHTETPECSITVTETVQETENIN